MYKINEIDFSYLENKQVLLLSDTGYPYPYILEFIEKLRHSNVSIYICPATTSQFVKLWLLVVLDKKVKIIKDKNYKMFFKNKIDEFEIVIIFGKKKNDEQTTLRKLLKSMLLSYKNITVVTEKGIDCDENNTLRR